MDKRDIGILMILGSYIFLLARTVMLYMEGVTNPLTLYRDIGSDPILFYVNLVLYLFGAYLLIGNASHEVRDLLINILFFVIPFTTLIFIISYLWIVGGAKGLLLLYGTAQFPLYHIFLLITVGIITVIRRKDLDLKRLSYALPFILVMAAYAAVRVFLGIYALMVLIFLVIVGVLTIFLTKKYMK